MSVYRKDSSGKLVKIAGSLTQRWNMLMLPTKHSKLSVINNEGQSFDYDCYEITEAAEPYITKLTEMTTYSLFLENANETTVVIVKYKNQSLFVYGVTSIGQLQDKIDLYTIDFSDFNVGNLVLNGIMYLSGDTSNFVQKNTIADLQGVQQDTTNDTAKLEFNSTALANDYIGTFVLQNANKTEYNNNQCRIAHFKHNTDISKQRLLAQLTTQTGTDVVTNLIGFGAQTDGKGLIGDVNRPVGWFAQVFGRNLNTVKTLELDTEGLWLDNQEISPNVVRYDQGQSLTDAQKTQAQKNLGIDQTITFAESERQKSKNLFPYSTIAGREFYQQHLNTPIKAGTYTISALVSSSDTDSDLSDVIFESEDKSYNVTVILNRDGRSSAIFTIYQDCSYVTFFASHGYVASVDDTFTYSDIQIEEGSVATDYQPYNGAIVHEKELSNPNLLINGDFRVNQRGKTSYTHTGEAYGYTYFVDRWFAWGQNPFTFDASTKTLTPNTSNTYNSILSQWIEDVSGILGKTITYSVSINGTVYSKTLNIPTTLSNNVSLGELSTSFGKLRVWSNNNRLRFDIIVSYNQSIVLNYAKVEISSIATAYSPRPYAEELALCQRYYYKITQNNSIFNGFVFSESVARVSVITPQVMRTSPTMILNDVSLCRAYSNGNAYFSSNVGIGAFGENNITINMQATQNMTQNMGVSFRFLQPVEFDAEIY